MLQNDLLHLPVFPCFQRPSLEICRASRICTCLASGRKYLCLSEGGGCCLRRRGMGPGVSLQSKHAVFRPRLPAAVLTGHQDFQVPGHCKRYTTSFFFFFPSLAFSIKKKKSMSSEIELVTGRLGQLETGCLPAVPRKE